MPNTGGNALLNPGSHHLLSSLYMYLDLLCKEHVSPFNEGKTEVQGGEVIGPMSQSQEVQSQDSHPGLPAFHSHAGPETVGIAM